MTTTTVPLDEKTAVLAGQLRLFKAAVPLAGLNTVDTAALRRLFDSGISADSKLFNGLSEAECSNLISWLISEFGVQLPKLNSTFYKSFESVEQLSEFELRVDQFLHYLSTYGNNRELRNSGNIYEPQPLSDEDLERMQVYAKSFTAFKAISAEELLAKTEALLTSGVALAEQATADLLAVVTKCGLKIDAASINNKEFLCRLVVETGFVPATFDDAVRAAMFALTERPLLIKSYELYNGLSGRWDEFSTDAVRKAAEIITAFYKANKTEAEANAQRYRVFLLLLKKAAANQVFSASKSSASKFWLKLRLRKAVTAPEFSTLINQLLRRTKSHYQAVETPVISRVFASVTTEAEISKLAQTANTFQLVRLLNAANERLTSANALGQVFRIRNGKTFVTSYANSAANNAAAVSTVFLQALKSRFCAKLEDKAIVIPAGIDYALPTSAKSSLGAIPLFTTIQVAGDVVVGIAWEQDADLDLHAIGVNQHFGWNASYHDDDALTYSGDMTSTNKHGFAAEYFRVRRIESPVIVNVTGYYVPRKDKTPFQFVISEKGEDLSHSAGIFDAFSNILMTAKTEIAVKETKSFILVAPAENGGKTIIFANLGATSGRRVPDVDRQRVVLDSTLTKAKLALTVRKLADTLAVPVFESVDLAAKFGYSKDLVFNFDPMSLTDSTFVDFIDKN